MSELQRIRERREDGCMEALEYYADLMDRGRKLSDEQLKDYEHKCDILMCMGVEASKYAETMLNLLNK